MEVYGVGVETREIDVPAVINRRMGVIAARGNLVCVRIISRVSRCIERFPAASDIPKVRAT